jgi:hypothetical protein
MLIRKNNVPMSKTYRYDAIVIHSGVSEEDFETFMTDELLPFFSKQYKGPTRTSCADLEGQCLFKNALTPGQYLWITTWAGAPDSVRGSFFENVRMQVGSPSENARSERVVATEAILKKVESFGKRISEELFIDVINTIAVVNA